MRAASLDHAMWFHRPFRVDDWLLYELDSPTSQGGRGLAHGRFYDREGRLVASVSQESMIRLPDAG
jgi:acyl-CoA thioesterase-2